MSKQLDEETLAILNNYGTLLNNTGGNDPIELLLDYYNNDRRTSINIVRHMLAFATNVQVNLIKRLQKEGLLITKEQLARYQDSSWAANPDRMGS